jgi:hypothetical protein
MAFGNCDGPVAAGIGDDQDLDPAGLTLLRQQRGKAACDPALFVVGGNDHAEINIRHQMHPLRSPARLVDNRQRIKARAELSCFASCWTATMRQGGGPPSR